MSSALREIVAFFGIEVDTAQLEAAEKKVESFADKLGKLKEVLEGVAAVLAVEKIKEFVFGMAEGAEKLKHQAEAVNMSTDALQEWQFAASMSGVGADQLQGAMMRLEKAAAGGGKGVAKLGFNAKDAHGKVLPMNDLLEKVADHVEHLGKDERAAYMMANFGKQGAKLVPMMAEGKEGIRKFREEVQRLGGGMSADFIKKSELMLQNSKRLNFAWESFKVNVVGAIMPAITVLIEWLTKGAVLLVDLAQNSSLLETAFIAFGIAAVIALSPLIASFAALLLEMLPLIVAFLLVEDFITFLRGGDSEFGRAIDGMFGAGAGEKVRKWITDAVQDFLNFVDMITGGSSDAANHWREDWEFFKTQLVKDFGDLGRLVVWFLGLFTGGWSHMTEQIGAVWNIAMILLQAAWALFTRGAMSGIYLVEDIFANFVNGILDGVKLLLQGFRALASLAHQSGMVESMDKAIGAIQGSSMMNRHLKEGSNEYDSEAAARTAQLLVEGDKLAGVKTVSTASMAADAKYAQENGTGTRVDQKVDVHINVPAGTPHGVAHAAGEAAEAGTKRATRAALIPGED